VVDSDGDGVSDRCDPNLDPAKPDRIYAFEGFAGGVPANWSAVGSWVADPLASFPKGSVVATAGSGVSSLTIQAPASGHDTVSASVAIVARPTSNDSDVSTVDDDDPGTSCRLYDNGATPAKFFLWLATPNGSTATTMYEMIVGQTYLIEERRDGAEFGCHAEHADGSSSMDTPGRTSTMPSASPRAGLRVSGNTTSARFEWVMIVTND
jgi:hypothetical protein